MPRPTKSETLARIHQEALAEFDKIQSAVRDERMQCLQDRRFYSIAGAQWEDEFGAQFENKPRMEVNKTHLSVIRIINEYRNNRITVDFQPTDGSDADDLADACDDLYRADEQNSVANEAYDNAFEDAVGGGMGAWRLRADYVDDSDAENEQQHICIEPIYDADSCVFFDLGAHRQDKSDGKRCYVLNPMSRDEYKAEYGDDPATWPKEISRLEFDWVADDTVYVCEHYRVEEKSELAHVWESLDGAESRYTDSDFAEDDQLEMRLRAIGSKEIRQKRIKRRQVHKYIFSGGKVLEDAGIIAGQNIPIVPTYGKRWIIDNVERCMGHVRLCKDAQRLKNMQLSKLAEISALSSVEKPILTPEQIAGHQTMWSEDNIKNYPYLIINAITDANGQKVAGGPVAYTKVPNIPPAMAALLQLTEEDMKDLLGNQEQGEELQPNISGKALELIQNKLDMQSFIYMSNFAKAVKRSGEIWLSMAKDVMVEKDRAMKGVGAQGDVRQIKLLQQRVNPKTGEIETENDLSRANYDVYVGVGPSSTSRRAATVRSLIGMASVTDDPETKQILGSMSMLNMEGEGIDEVRDWFRRRLIKMGAVKPTEEERAELAAEQQNQRPDPNSRYLEAAATQAEAEAEGARATVVQKVADAEYKKAQAAKAIQDLDMAQVDQILSILDRIAGGQPAQPQQQ